MNVAKPESEAPATVAQTEPNKTVIDPKPDTKDAGVTLNEPVEEKVGPVTGCVEESAKMSDCMMEQQQTIAMIPSQQPQQSADPQQQQQQMQIDQQQQHHLMEQCAVAQQQKLEQQAIEQQAIEQQASLAAGMMDQQTGGGWSGEMTGASNGYDETVSGYQCNMYTPDSSTASVHSIGHGYNTDTGHDTGGYNVQPAGDNGPDMGQGNGEVHTSSVMESPSSIT